MDQYITAANNISTYFSETLLNYYFNTFEKPRNLKTIEKQIKNFEYEKFIKSFRKEFELTLDTDELVILLVFLVFKGWNFYSKSDFKKLWTNETKASIEINKFEVLKGSIPYIAPRVATENDIKSIPISEITFHLKNGEKVRIMDAKNIHGIIRGLQRFDYSVKKTLIEKRELIPHNKRTLEIKAMANGLFQYLNTDPALKVPNGKKLTTKMGEAIFRLLSTSNIINQRQIESLPKDYIRSLLR